MMAATNYSLCLQFFPLRILPLCHSENINKSLAKYFLHSRFGRVARVPSCEPLLGFLDLPTQRKPRPARLAGQLSSWDRSVEFRTGNSCVGRSTVVDHQL